jgi:hypothetical protein
MSKVPTGSNAWLTRHLEAQNISGNPGDVPGLFVLWYHMMATIKGMER